LQKAQAEMKVQIISTGDEVLSGAVVDSNAAWIAGRLYEAGIAVDCHVCVGDDRGHLASVICQAAGQADAAVVTGGLGPTVDDITAQAAALAAGVNLKPHPEATAYLKDFFRRLGRSVSDSDLKQAVLPETASVILNPVGTAPGFTMIIDGCRFFFLPGVPFEMRKMMQDHVISALKSLAAHGRTPDFYREKRLSLFGLPEAKVNERLADLTGRIGNVKLGMLAEFPVIHVKLSGFGKNLNDLDSSLESAASLVREKLGRFLFSETGQSMEEVVGRLLKKQGATLALAESCTGGLISSRITNVAGSSDYFLCSAVTYSNEAKIRMLGVLPETLEAFGAVSEQTALEMARGAAQMSKADYAVSVTGIAGPGGGTAQKPVGTVCIGVFSPKGSYARRYCFPFENRMANKLVFAEAALNRLRKTLINK
jgi:nicotinamide-nucleotide amidase